MKFVLQMKVIGLSRISQGESLLFKLTPCKCSREQGYAIREINEGNSGVKSLMSVDESKLIKWECLARYFLEKRGKILDAIFDNPLCEDEKRNDVLKNLDINDGQKKFLLNVFDIDYIYIRNNKPILIEEKRKNIESHRFHERNYVYLSHGTTTQYKHLREAYELGIEAGILLRCVKFKRTPKGLLGYAIVDPENVEYEESKFYPIQNCEYLPLSNQTKIPVDDFIKGMRNKARKQ